MPATFFQLWTSIPNIQNVLRPSYKRISLVCEYTVSFLMKRKIFNNQMLTSLFSNLPILSQWPSFCLFRPVILGILFSLVMFGVHFIAGDVYFVHNSRFYFGVVNLKLLFEWKEMVALHSRWLRYLLHGVFQQQS